MQTWLYRCQTTQGVGKYRRKTCSPTEDACRCQRYYYGSQTENREMEYEHSRMQEVLGEDRDLYSIQLQGNMLATFNNILVSSLELLVSTLTDCQQEIINEAGYTDLTRNCNQIIDCAMLLSLDYIREATTYAESCGGGCSPDSGDSSDKISL